MEQVDIEVIKQKTTVSVVFLSLRNIGIQAISFGGFFLLTLLLGTGEVGLFSIVAESVSILGYFSDVGLASALIQQKDQISKSEMQTTFVIQQLLVFVALSIVAIIYPQIAHAKSYGPAEFWILISLCFSFACASLKTIPSIQLERQLNFRLLSTIDIIENTIFYVVAVILAFFGFGVYSYAISTFIRSLVGLLIIYKISPWPIGFSFNLNSAKKLFRYGIPFQLNSLIAVAKDRLSNLLVAGIIGRDAFGILAWAQKGPRVPLSFMDAIMRVTFPTFARIQDEKEFLRKSIEKSIYYIAFFVFPALAGIAIIAPDFINLIPKYGKWLPAIIPMYFFTINAAIAAVTTPLTNAFNAVGKIAITTKLMIMWTILTWIFYPILSYRYGYIGTSVATLIVGSSSFIVWYLAHRILEVDTLKTIIHPTLASTFIVIAATSINQLHLTLPVSLVSKIISGVLIYFIYSIIFSRKEIEWFVTQLRCLVTKK